MIEFIVPCYGNATEVHRFIHSMYCQTNDNWLAHYIFDGDDHNYYSIGSSYDKIKNRFSLLAKNHKDWGHTPREFGKDRSIGQWIVMTGVDNYYVPTFVEEFSRFTGDPNIDFIYCNMVHDGYDYQPFDSKPAFNYIDIGNFAIRSEIAKQIPLNKTYAADGEFVEEYKKRFGTSKIKKIDKYLYVHN